MTATARKTSLKKYVRSASNFHALFPSCSIRQIWRFFLELNSNRLYQSSGKEKEGRCLAFTPSTEREIRRRRAKMARKCTKLKAWCTCKVVVLLIKPIAFFPFLLPSSLSLFKLSTVGIWQNNYAHKKEKEVKGSSLPNTLIVIVCVTEISRPWPKGDGGKT